MNDFWKLKIPGLSAENIRLAEVYGLLSETYLALVGRPSSKI